MRKQKVREKMRGRKERGRHDKKEERRGSVKRLEGKKGWKKWVTKKRRE